MGMQRNATHRAAVLQLAATLLAVAGLLTACGEAAPDDGVILVAPDPNYEEREPPVFEAPPPVEVALPAPPDLGPLEGWKPPDRRNSRAGFE